MAFQGHKSVAKHDGSTEESWHAYKCGFCGAVVSGAVVASTSWSGVDMTLRRIDMRVRWIQCTNCGLGSVENNGNVQPGVAFGPMLEGLPSDVELAYEEARRTMAVPPRGIDRAPHIGRPAKNAARTSYSPSFNSADGR